MPSFSAAFSIATAGLWVTFASVPDIALAETGLTGRTVSFQVVTYDDPARPLFKGILHRATVGKGPEFGLTLEGVQNQIDVVPVLVDIGVDRIALSYAETEPGKLYSARFNGYVLSFEGDCAPVESARVDFTGTTLELDNKRVRVDGKQLLVNVAGLSYNRASRIAVDLVLSPCAVD